MTDRVRTRFAPSPTGFLHVGSIRTALFDWLFTRHNNGVFILRIEDTDITRKVEGAIEAILDDLRWLNLDWDEGPEVGGKYGPYIQSQRLEQYKETSDRLIALGAAYKCYCSQERLEALRAQQTKNKLPPGYDRHCRNLTEAERVQKEKEGITPVVRLKTPLQGETVVHDIIWGDVVFKNSTIEDLVLLKSDGYPTYHLANIVDDHDMQMTHVIRAEEWMSSTPCHILLYGALGYEIPRFAHLPMLLGSDRSKLGKRHGSTSIREFREQGYLSEAMINFLALLGWSLDDKTEIFSREDLIKNFSLERVSKTAAIFNHEKLKWMNGVYIRKLTPADFAQRCLPFLKEAFLESIPSMNYVRAVLPLVQERTKLLTEVPELTHYFFSDQLNYDVKLLISKDMTAASTRGALAVAKERLEKLPGFDAQTLEAMLRPLAEELKLKTGQLFGALRTAVSGETATPPLFQMMAVLGRERCLTRIQEAIDKLAAL